MSYHNRSDDALSLNVVLRDMYAWESKTPKKNLLSWHVSISKIIYEEDSKRESQSFCVEILLLDFIFIDLNILGWVKVDDGDVDHEKSKANHNKMTIMDSSFYPRIIGNPVKWLTPATTPKIRAIICLSQWSIFSNSSYRASFNDQP